MLKEVMVIKRIIYILAAVLTGYVAYVKFNWSVFNYAILLVAVLSYQAYSSILPLGSRSTKIASTTLSLIFTFFIVLPKLQPAAGGQIPLSTFLLMTSFNFLLILTALRFVLAKLENYTLCRSESTELSNRRVLILFFAALFLIFAAYIPSYLADFPGVMVTDSQNELKMIQGILPLNDNHPLAHTMMIKVLFSLGELLAPGNEDAGIICYCIVQMLMAAAVFSYALVTMLRCNVKYWFVAVTLLFFAFTSYHSTHSFLVWKDTPFSLCVLAFAVTIFRIVYKHRQNKLPEVADAVLLFLSAFGTCMFRHNGIAAILLPAFVLCWIYRKSARKIVVALLLVFVLFGFYKGPLLDMLDLKSHDSVEALSIPIQQISRAIVDGAQLTDEEYKLLSGLVDIEKIPETYVPGVSDYMKSLVRKTDNYQQYIENHSWQLLKLYLNLGLRYPISYISAHADQTLCYWYPDTDSVVLMTHTLSGNPSTPLSQEMWRSIHAANFKYASLPYYGLLYSVGGVFWICLILVGVCFIRKQYLELLVALPSMCVMLTILMGTSVNNEMRYVYSMFTCLPMISASALCRRRISGAAAAEAVDKAAEKA